MDLKSRPIIQSLRFENLSFAYEANNYLFENIDFDFPMNELVWIRANSGAGRSTLLQILAGLSSPSRGKYFINDSNITEMSFDEFLPFRLSIGYGFDYGGLINNRTLLENLLLPLNYHKACSTKEALEKVLFYVHRLSLERYKDLRPALLPGRVRKLACLIRALLLEPQILLLDDPTVGLSQETVLKYFDIVELHRKEKSLKHIFISSFDDSQMALLNPIEIFIEVGALQTLPTDSDKKVVHL